MRTILELINGGALTLMSTGALVMVGGAAREARRTMAESDATAPGGSVVTRVWAGARTSLSVALSRAVGGYMAAERWLGARIPAWVALPWLRMVVTTSGHRAAGRARRIGGSLANGHRQGALTVARVRKQLTAEAVAILARGDSVSASDLRWAERVMGVAA